MATQDPGSKIFRDYGIAVAGAVIIAFFIRSFVVEAYRMPSRAMYPTLEAGDTIFVSKWNYRTGHPIPQYGDTVVFSFPDDPEREYIKRVIGRPGDLVELSRGKVSLNGRPLTKAGAQGELCAEEILPGPYTIDVCFEPPLMNTETAVRVGLDQVFVVGDLRSQPNDFRKFRYFGIVPIRSIKGQASFIWLSIQPPAQTGTGGDWFSRLRFERMFKRIH